MVKNVPTSSIICGDCEEVLRDFPDDCIDLIFTSPPYADCRKDTYGGIHPDKYVEWFLPISGELYRILKPSGTFILNIKERVVNGERHTYVLQLIMSMSGKMILGKRRSAGCRWLRFLPATKFKLMDREEQYGG